MDNAFESGTHCLTKLYRHVRQWPTVTGARLRNQIGATTISSALPQVYTVELTQSQMDWTRPVNRVTNRQVVVAIPQPTEDPECTKDLEPLCSTVSTDRVNVDLQQWSPSGTQLAVLRTVEDKESKSSKRFVEVWQAAQLVTCVEVTDLHDAFYSDSTFGSLSWAAKETHLVYVAEASSDKDPYSKFDYRPDWGERLDGKIKPTLFVVDLIKAQVNKVDLATEEFSPAQVIFGPKDANLVFVGYHRNPQPHGLVYCFNRPMAIYKVDLDGSQLHMLSDPHLAARSPRLSPDQCCLIYLANELGGPHNACSTLVCYDWATQTNRTIVPVVNNPADHPDGFPGLYLDSLPGRPWLTMDTHPESAESVLCQSLWGCRTTLLQVHLETGKVQNLTPDTKTGSWSVLDVHSHYVVAVQSTPVQPHALYIGHVFPNQPLVTETSTRVIWRRLMEPLKGKYSQDILNTLTEWEVLSFSERFPGLEAILVRPQLNPSKDQHSSHPWLQEWQQQVPLTDTPLIVFSHGGPHSAFTTAFSWQVAGFVMAGFTVLMTNYRGSTGYGNDAVRSLVGHLGEAEVDDVHYMAQRVLRDYVDKGLSERHVCYYGGSYGGFIGAHLSARYPDAYHAFVLRNPVINIGAMAATTDIPDWCAFEIGHAYNYQGYNPVPPALYQVMHDMSPMPHVKQVKTPTMLFLGTGDRRVPPYEGKSWYNALKAKGTLVELKLYTNVGHALDTVEVENAQFYHCVKFFVTKGCALPWHDKN
ncbi:hypothetical protein IWQ61_000189 [Dispira simplex]|nr:hypothetical protein IWQ61_000189 [Dispira simplex]